MKGILSFEQFDDQRLDIHADCFILLANALFEVVQLLAVLDELREERTKFVQLRDFNTGLVTASDKIGDNQVRLVLDELNQVNQFVVLTCGFIVVDSMLGLCA